MSHLRIAASVVFLLALVAMADAKSIRVAEEERKGTAESVTLFEDLLSGDKSKVLAIEKFTLPPGFVGGRHYYRGAVYVYVLEGELTVEVDGKETKTVKAGNFYKEPLWRDMVSRNLSTWREVHLLVIRLGETGKREDN